MSAPDTEPSPAFGCLVLATLLLSALVFFYVLGASERAATGPRECRDYHTARARELCHAAEIAGAIEDARAARDER